TPYREPLAQILHPIFATPQKSHPPRAIRVRNTVLLIDIWGRSSSTRHNFLQSAPSLRACEELLSTLLLCVRLHWFPRFRLLGHLRLATAHQEFYDVLSAT